VDYISFDVMAQQAVEKQKISRKVRKEIYSSARKHRKTEARKKQVIRETVGE